MNRWIQRQADSANFDRLLQFDCFVEMYGELGICPSVQWKQTRKVAVTPICRAGISFRLTSSLTIFLKMLSPTLAEEMAQGARFRNVLSHTYGRLIDHDVVYNALQDLERYRLVGQAVRNYLDSFGALDR